MPELIKEFFVPVGVIVLLLVFAFICAKIILFLFDLSCTISYKVEKYKRNKEFTEEHLAGKPTLTFEQFVSFYNISPEKFYCYDDYIVFLGREGFSLKTYGDLEKYKQWLKNSKKSKTELKTAKSYEFLTSTIEADIKNKLAEVAKEQEEILQRMKQEESGI